MSRISYSDDESFPGAFGLWDANCYRSIRGHAGQKALRELEAALMALPGKRLERDVFVVASGGVCALGALAVKRKMDAGLSRSEALAVCADMDPFESQDHGMALGLPSMVAWKVVAENDDANANWRTFIHEGPNPFPGQHAYDGYYHAGYYQSVEVDAELRYGLMLGWVRNHLTDALAQRGDTR